MMSNVPNQAPPLPTIAYIAPELTALSETFVYQELTALEDLGYRVLPFAVAEPRTPAREAQGIASRTIVLDSGPRWRQTLSAVRALRRLPSRVGSAFRLLLGDMARIGWRDRRSWALIPQWLAAARMAHMLLGERCLHIHAHFVHVPTQIAMYASALTGIPFTCTAHANDLFRHGVLLAEKAQRARKLLTISHFNKNWLLERGVDAERVDVVRCAPDVVTRESNPGRRRSGAYRIGTLGSLVERKGVDDLLRALALLIRSGCAPVRLVIAGEGPERLRLQVLADQLGVHPNVEFVGAVAHHAVAHWMRSLDLFVAACKADRHGEVDGIPVALMEAMSLGVPVVSTRISGVPELVIDGQTGFLAEPDQPQSLAARIDEAMSSPERARALGTAARAHVRWEFGREVNLRRLVAHFGLPSVPASQPAELEEPVAA
jgi:colanic acid/amylovoran biosynthesis glycosyltransferase